MKAVLPGADAADGGGPTARLGDLPEPRCSSAEVLVDIRATALNRADLLQLRGLYPPPPGETEIPGLECSGVIREVGSAVEGWSPGERVMALLAGGGHAERVAVPAGQLMSLPESLSFEEGAALPEACLTAWTNLVIEGGLAPDPADNEGKTVLVTGANGGVGTVTVQLARELGVRVIAAGRSAERLEPLRELGAHALVLEGEGLPERVREETGEATGRGGADLVFDLVSGEHLDRHLAALRERGRLVLVGLMAGPRARLDLAQVLRRRLTLMGSVLRARPREEKARLVVGFDAFARERIASGLIRPVIDRVLPFDEIAEAYKALERGGVTGKVLVRIDRTR